MDVESDRELLDLAAKAAGYVVTGLGGMSRGVFVHHEGAQPDECGDLPNFHWDPLTDDGDALRLAVAINRMMITYSDEDWERCGHDGYAATRRAIVRAAAEVGRAMP